MTQNLNTYFDKIYLLTIERNLNRQNSFAKNLANIDFKIFLGVDGKNLNLTELELAGEYDSLAMASGVDSLMKEYLGLPHYYEPKANMVACSMSHKEIYKDIVANNYARCLILEDDAVLLQDNLIEWQKITTQLPADWDLLYLGYQWKFDETLFDKIKRLYAYPFLHFSKIKKYNYNAITKGFAEKYSKNLLHAGTHAGTHAYAITKKCAEALIKEQSPIKCNPDLLFWELNMKHKIKAYASKPQLFTISNVQSSILGE